MYIYLYLENKIGKTDPNCPTSLGPQKKKMSRNLLLLVKISGSVGHTPNHLK